jgi:hypothetical protein
VNRWDRRKVESAEIKILRSVAEYTVLDYERNRESIKFFNLSEELAKEWKNWYKPILRMD